MKKTDMFNVERVTASYNGNVYSRPIYHSMSSKTDPIVFVEFSIYPTVNTRKLFKALLENYRDGDNCSMILENDIDKFKYSFTDEMDIIKSMSYTLYKAHEFHGEFVEEYVTYPVIVKTLVSAIGTTIQFDKNFKRFFEENFQI